jgi:hypothetical protein
MTICILLLAGNGAGKTTNSYTILQEMLNGKAFANADKAPAASFVVLQPIFRNSTDTCIL